MNTSTPKSFYEQDSQVMASTSREMEDLLEDQKSPIEESTDTTKVTPTMEEMFKLMVEGFQKAMQEASYSRSEAVLTAAP